MESPRVENAETRFEKRDFSARWVLFFGGCLVVALLLCAAILARLTTTWNAQTPDARQGALRNTAPEPALQPDPPADAAGYLRRQQARANSYGWVDAEADVAHIPLARAMDLALEEGFPVSEQVPEVAPHAVEPPPRLPPVIRDPRAASPPSAGGRIR